MQTVADRIQSRLAASDRKQADIVRVTGASKGTVSKWLSGTNTPKGNYLIALAKFLNVDSEWLLTGIEKETSTSDDVAEVLGWDDNTCLLYTSPSPRDGLLSRMPSSA